MNLALIPRNRHLVLLFSLFLGIIALVVGGGSVYLFEVKKNFHEALYVLLGGGVFILLLLIAWPSSQPVLLLSEEGLTDRRLGVGLILWADIQDVQIENRYGENQFICLRLNDPDKYVSRLAGPKLANIRFSQKLGFTMLNIDVSSFEIDPLELMEYIRKTANAARARIT